MAALVLADAALAQLAREAASPQDGKPMSTTPLPHVPQEQVCSLPDACTRCPAICYMRLQV